MFDPPNLLSYFADIKLFLLSYQLMLRHYLSNLRILCYQFIFSFETRELRITAWNRFKLTHCSGFHVQCFRWNMPIGWSQPLVTPICHQGTLSFPESDAKQNCIKRRGLKSRAKNVLCVLWRRVPLKRLFPKRHRNVKGKIFYEE